MIAYLGRNFISSPRAYNSVPSWSRRSRRGWAEHRYCEGTGAPAWDLRAPLRLLDPGQLLAHPPLGADLDLAGDGDGLLPGLRRLEVGLESRSGCPDLPNLVKAPGAIEGFLAPLDQLGDGALG